jgi:hypothetical protein
VQQLSIAILVGFVERLNQHLDGAAHLLAEGVGDFVLELQGAIEQCGQLFGLHRRRSGECRAGARRPAG